MTYERLLSVLSNQINLSEKDIEFCKEVFVPKKLRKRQYLLQEGDVCKYTAFVEKGLLRTFTVSDKGTEAILQFSMEDWWVADLYSFFTEEPSIYNIEALEDCELLMITHSSYDLLLKQIPGFERFFRILLQNNLIATQRRLMRSMTESAEEKYLNLLKDSPSCMQRVPQHMIASFLGISRETLSRIRSQLTKSS